MTLTDTQAPTCPQPTVVAFRGPTLVAPQPTRAAAPRSRFAFLWPASGAVHEIASMDGLRGVAVLLVLMVHSMYELSTQTTDPAVKHALTIVGPITGLGGTGVHLFFVLSGFLLFLPYARAALDIQPFPSTRRFMIRRALRILPTWWASLIIFCTVAALFATSYSAADITLHFLLLHNWTSTMLGSINGPGWTLALESQFYLTIPLFGWITLRLLRARRTRALIALGLALALSGAVMGLISIFVYRRLPAIGANLSLLGTIGFLPTFGAGMAAALLYVARTHNAAPAQTTAFRRFCRTGGLVGCALWIAHTTCVALHAPLERFNYFFFSLMAGVAYAGILLGVLSGWCSWRALLSSVPLRYVGGVSYSVYLWHYPLYYFLIAPFAVHHAHGFSQWLLVLLGTLILVVPLGHLSYLLFERPFIRVRQSKQ